MTNVVNKSIKMNPTTPAKQEIPAYLTQFARPSSLSVALLLEAWNDLSLENQVLILQNHARFYPPDLFSRIFSHTARSQNAYIRYLTVEIAGHLHEISAVAADDTSPWVAAQARRALGNVDTGDPVKFFAKGQAERLVIASSLQGHGLEVANLVRHYYENRGRLLNVSELDVHDIVSAYVQSDTFSRYYSAAWGLDGYIEQRKGRDLHALWALLPIVSLQTAKLLIECLPEDAGLSPFDESSVQGIPEQYWIWILSNPSLQLTKLRHKLFNSTDHSSHIIHAAVSCNFRLTDAEFSKILGLDSIARERTLSCLIHAADIHISMKLALRDLLQAKHLSTDTDATLWDVESLNRDVSRSLASCVQAKQLASLNEVRLYKLAKRFAPWGDICTKDRLLGLGPYYSYLQGFPQDRFIGLTTWDFYVELKALSEQHNWFEGDACGARLGEKIGLDEFDVPPPEITTSDIRDAINYCRRDVGRLIEASICAKEATESVNEGLKRSTALLSDALKQGHDKLSFLREGLYEIDTKVREIMLQRVILLPVGIVLGFIPGVAVGAVSFWLIRMTWF